MIKNVKDIEVGQKVYYVMLRDGKYQPFQGEVEKICCGIHSRDILALVVDFGFLVERYKASTNNLFDDLHEAVLFAKKLNRTKDNGANGQIAKCELITCYTAYEKSEFVGKLKKKTDEYQNNGYYVEIQYSLTDIEYSALVIAREQ